MSHLRAKLLITEADIVSLDGLCQTSPGAGWVRCFAPTHPTESGARAGRVKSYNRQSRAIHDELEGRPQMFAHFRPGGTTNPYPNS